MNEAELLIDLMIDYYNVNSVSQLADEIGIGQPALSKWKKNNSVNAIKKKCRELGIYNAIFGDSNISISQGSHSRAAGGIYNENNSDLKEIKLEFEDTTIALLKDLIGILGEEEVQFKLMEIKRNARR